MEFSNYVGIPYQRGGRTRDGLDCWGLVRLVYAEQRGIELPSFVEFDNGQAARVAELVAQQKERWIPIDSPLPGDVVVLRLEGHEAHVGLVVEQGRMLHALDGVGSSVERFDTGKWRHRVGGFYRYDASAQSAPIIISACPHPLRTQRIDDVLPAGASLQAMVEHYTRAAGWPSDAPVRGVAFVDGAPVSQDDWSACVPRAGSRVEFRVVAAGGSTGRLVAMIAIAVAAWYFAPLLMGYGAGSAGWAAAGAAAAAGTGSVLTVQMAAMGLNMAGTLLFNAIFPIRPPDAGPAMTGPRPQYMLNGGQNPRNPYGAVPVVLGRHRFTPPVAANPYSETSATQSWLNLALCWGYGPLQVTDLRIGDTDISTLEDVRVATLSGTAGEDQRGFNALYGRDVTQIEVGTELACVARAVSSATRSAGIVTVTTTEAHEYALGSWATLENTGGVAGAISEIVGPDSFRFPHAGPDGTILQLTETAPDIVVGAPEEGEPPAEVERVTASPWTERVIDAEVDRINAVLHFPEGLRRVTIEGARAGDFNAAPVSIVIQARQIDSETLQPLSGWTTVHAHLPGGHLPLQPSWYNIDDDAQLEPVYQWVRISLNEHNQAVMRRGAYTTHPDLPPSGILLQRQQAEHFGLNATFARLPDYGPGEEGLWDLCIHGDAVHSAVDRRGASGGLAITGCDLTTSGLSAWLSPGSIQRAGSEYTTFGAEGRPLYLRKDAASHAMVFDVARGKYEVRVRRVNDSAKEGTFPDSGNKYQNLHTTILQSISGFRNARPITPPAPLAMTALRIKATNQLNGNLQGIAGTVTSICLDWDNASAQWIKRPTRNPAALYRYVLQHPANAQRVTDSKLDLPALQDWANFCRNNGFMFDHVITGQQSLMDVLRDIAAAGRASPHLVDGRWTVIIDRPRTLIAQHFTPHNSWGFEGVRALPKMPHAFRVSFSNAERGYQMDERIVYNDGYSASNATQIEGLQLPGVTSHAAVFKHARFHLAQLKLRPETYTLNADIEHVVCNRGDLVRVTHDVPMWGLATGRIKTHVSGTVLDLDESVPMKAGVSYTLRIRRTDNGASVVRSIVPAATDGTYTRITLTASVDAGQGEPGNLWMMGELNSESVELIVQAIEPGDNMTARLTLVDYSPAVYTSDTEAIPDFESQITKPPVLLQNAITQAPVISAIQSDATVMTVLSPGRYAYNVRVSFRAQDGLPAAVKYLEGQIDFAGDRKDEWNAASVVPLSAGAITFGDVQEARSYRLRLRYVDDIGRTGPWCAIQTHTVIGKTAPPAAPASLEATVSGSRLQLNWPDSPERDVVGYEVRTVDADWGAAGYVFKGAASACLVDPPAAGQSRTWYVRTLDAAGLWSTSAASAAYTTTAVPAPANLRESFYDTSLTTATITLDWDDAAPDFGLRHYRVSDGVAVRTVSASTITLPAAWIGARTFSVEAIDRNSNVSAPLTKTITKLAPNPPSAVRAQVIDNNVMLYWTLPARTTLPIAHTLIKRGISWATAVEVGTKSGAFTTLQELAAGTYTYWLATVDTDGYTSEPVSVTANVSAPPDFSFHGAQESAFTGALSSAALE